MLYDSEQILLERATKGVYKKAILENFSIFTEKQGHKKQIKIYKDTYFEEHLLLTAASVLLIIKLIKVLGICQQIFSMYVLYI